MSRVLLCPGENQFLEFMFCYILPKEYILIFILFFISNFQHNKYVLDIFQSNPKLKIEGCNTALLQNVEGNPICFVLSKENGEFSFGLVPAGQYYLVALEKQPGPSKTVYNIQPNKIEFKVEHNSVDLKNAFEVENITII